MVDGMLSTPVAIDCTRTDILLERARGIAETLQSRSLEIAKARHLPGDIMRQLQDAGLMSLVRPVRYGGPELGMDLCFRIGMELAKGDASTAWVYTVLNSHDHLMGLFSKDIQDEFWASANPASASSYAPSGKPVREDGGWRLSGKWSFCSGIDFCDWVVLGAVTGMIPGERPAPDLHLFLLKKSEIKIVDDWHVMGLSGTGSKSVVVDGVFIPDNRVLRNLDVLNANTPGAAIHENPLYHASIWLLFCFAIVAPAVGIARGAYDYAVADCNEKVAKKDPMFEGRRAQCQAKLAEVSALIDAASLLFERGLSETYSFIQSRGPIPLSLRLRNRRDQAFLMDLCRKALDILMSIAGGRGIREEGVIQRCFRDLYAISGHPAANWDSASFSFGSVLLGGPPTEMFY